MCRIVIHCLSLVIILSLSPLRGAAKCQDGPSIKETAADVQTSGDPPVTSARESARGQQSVRWLVLMCGHPGDDDHRNRLTEAVQNIASAAKPVFNVDPEHMTVLVGDTLMADAIRSDVGSAAVCTRETVSSALLELSSRIQPTDSLLIILLGHAQLYAGRSTFNVQDSDFDATELAKWMQPIQCNEKVTFVTMPVSGFWLKPLAGPRTVTVSGTDVDLEHTGTEMPYALADVVSGRALNQPLEDVDGDGRLSLLDLYLAVNLEIHARFKSMDRLQTEHAQLDDNGDGVGAELQTPYLPVEAEAVEAGEQKIARPRLPLSGRDGDFSRRIEIGQPPKVDNNSEPVDGNETEQTIGDEA